MIYIRNNVKNNLKNIIIEALKKSFEIEAVEGLVEIQKAAKNVGSDYCTNIAMKLAKQLKMDPMEVADKILLQIEKSDMYECSAAKPGYINFIIKNTQKNNIVREILDSNNLLESYKTNQPKKINVEFVSANPTGPLHVGHGRGAIYGNIIAKFLKIQGHNVTKEYYLNDWGKQTEMLFMSVMINTELRFKKNPKTGNRVSKENLIKDSGLEGDVYQGEYIKNIANDYDKEFKAEDYPTPEERWAGSKAFIVDRVTKLIKKALNNLDITFDNWFAETQLHHKENDSDSIYKKVLKKLADTDHLIKIEGAIMLKSDEPRVLIKSNQEITYFASDLAYHDLKMKKYDRVIDVWGADHHGYVPRMIAGLKALGHDTDKLDIHLIQFANLFRGKEKVSMSTRKGEFVELEALRKEIGNDAMNFFYLTKNKDQHLDFDLNLAITENKNNPVYYIQYAHARIEKILNEAKNYQSHKYDLESLDNELEQNIVSTLLDFNEICEKTIMGLQPHMMTHYLQKLAQDFHSYYANVKILTDEINYSRIYLIAAIQKVLKCGLDLLNINAPKEM